MSTPDPTHEPVATSVSTTSGTPTLRPSAMAFADRATLGAMALGIVVILQPWWPGGLALGFFLTLGATVLQIIVSHLA